MTRSSSSHAPQAHSGQTLIASRWTTLRLSSQCGIVALICYFATLTHVHTFDALSYILDVDRKPWHELFHPHHLAYGPLGALVAWLAAAIGWQHGAALPMQLTNAIAGAAGVALFSAIIHQRTNRSDLAYGGALLLGGSYAYWYYAVEVEVYTIAALFLLLCLWLMMQLLQRSCDVNVLSVAVGLGLAQGMAVLFHQTNLLLSLPIFVTFFLRAHMMHHQRGMVSRALLRETIILWGCYTLALMLVVGSAYTIVIVAISDLHSWNEILRWLTSYAHTGWWGKPITSDTWADLAKGLSETLVQPGGAFTGLVLLGIVVLSARKLIRSYAPLVSCLVLWLLIYGGFFLWWEPDNIEFWIASLPPALLLVVLALGTHSRPWHAGVWIAMSIGLAHVFLNAEAISARGRGETTPQWRIAYHLAEQTSETDLILVADGLQELYLQYYAHRPLARSLNHILHEHGGNWENACAWLHTEMEAAMQRGDAILVGDALLYPNQAMGQFVDPLIDRFGITQAHIDDCFAPYRTDMQPLILGEGLPIYYRIPSAQERVEGMGWDFSHHRQGWRAANIRDEHFGMGWDVIPEIDPYFLSPPFRIEAEEYCTIEVRIAVTTENREFELFVVDEGGMTTPERSVRWHLEEHAGMATYWFPLRGAAGWSGIVRGLRLDPVALGDGGRVRLEGVRLWRECLAH